MSDLEWLQLVDRFLGEFLPRAKHEDARGRLAANETYKLAYSQWTGGASGRVVEMLLRRAAVEAGLMEW